MIDTAEIENAILEFPIVEYKFGKTEELFFTDKVRYICEIECPMYGKSWSCPPAVGTVEECRQRCLKYENMFIFTTIAQIDDMEDFDKMLETRGEHEKVTHAINKIIKDKCGDTYALSSESCQLCKKCTYPDGECVHKDKMLPCIESHGILVVQLAEQKEMMYSNGYDILTWFGIILY